LASRETLDTQLNVFADFRPKLPAGYADSPYVLLGNIQPQLQLDVLAQIKAPKFVAADTMNFWISGERKKLGEVLSKIDTLMINDEELRQLAEIHNIRRAAAAVRKLGPKRLIVKRGEYGAMLFDDDGVFFTPAYPLEEEIDPTGAGDSFAGALLGYLAAAGTLDCASLRRGLSLASAVASFCVEGVGPAKLKAVQRADVMMRLEALRTLTHAGG
jgi:sugar/nucleoside kinase (ribokinase family)